MLLGDLESTGVSATHEGLVICRTEREKNRDGTPWGFTLRLPTFLVFASMWDLGALV